MIERKLAGAVAGALAAILASSVATTAACIPIEGGTLKFRPAASRLVWKARDKSLDFLMADPTQGTTSITITSAGASVLAITYGTESAPAWQSSGAPPTKWRYKFVNDPSPTPGIERITSTATRFIMKGRGGVLTPLTTPAALPVTFQVVDSAGGCITVTFSSCRQNDTNALKCKRDTYFNTITTDMPNSIDTIIDDATLPHQARLHGVPLDFPWALGPFTTAGNNPPSNFTALTGWGQVYEAANGNRARNTRVQIRNFQAYVLSIQDGQWHLLQNPAAVIGGAWREDFQGNVSVPADVRPEIDGGISAKVGGGYNFHFFPDTRASISPNDFGGVFVTTQARLILDDPSGRDDRAKARYLLNLGADYWIDLVTDFQDFTTNVEVSQGRFRYVTTGWHWFNMTTLTDTELRQNPPPIQ
ncbi:MAG: hypothetical protein D6815_08040 [Candidatus Dadabacteria bacterium]|nr:MAG: hypothetical protein D6815_08040 [Candidatus Dadabacteria bacterium]